MLTESNFWLTTVQQPGFPQEPLPARVDVAIIGGGYTGLSAARTLAKGGASVAVFEAQTVGWGASSRNGGMVLTGMKLGVEALVHRYGRERAKRLFALSLAAIDTVERIVTEENIACAFSRCGHVEAAWKPAHFNGYARAAEALEKEFGHRVRVLPRSRQHEELGSEVYHGLMVDDLSAGVNPAQLVMGLAQAAHRAGAQLHEHTMVTEIQKTTNGFMLTTNRGALHATHVIAATSGYTGALTPALRKRVIPIGSYIIATAPLSESQARQVIPHNRMIFDSKHFLYYWRLTPDYRMLFGGRAAFTPETPNSIRQSADILRQGLLHVHPQLAAVEREYVWGGTLDFTYDIMPHVGALDGIHHALGYAGHGVAFATHLGDLLGQHLLGKQAENPLQDLPFKPVPLYNGNPLLHLPLAGLYYKWLDFIE